MDSVNGFVSTVTEECSSVVRCEQGVLLVISVVHLKFLRLRRGEKGGRGGGRVDCH